MRFLLLPFTRPIAAAAARVRELVPESGRRRDFLRGLAGFPVALLALSASAPGCAAGQSSSLAVTQVDSFTVGHTSEDGMTLEFALMKRADSLGVQLGWHDSVAPDAVDCVRSIGGPRLVRWDYRYGSSTDARHYLFEVYDETGYPVGNEPTLEMVLRTGYTVVVLEVSAASSA